MNEESNYGALLQGNDLKLNREWFTEMAQLIGIRVVYKAPRSSKSYTEKGEIKSAYDSPIAVWCIFDEHPTQQTMKKLGWDSELLRENIIISVPYDLPNIQQGALFVVPSSYDHTQGRVFQVVKLSTIMIYPSSITCELVPYYATEFTDSNYDNQQHDFNLLGGEE